MRKKKIEYPGALDAMKIMPPGVHRPEADRIAGGFRPEHSKVFEWIMKGGSAYALAEMVFDIAKRWGLVSCPLNDELEDEYSRSEDGEVWKYWGCCLDEVDESIKYHGKPVCELKKDELPRELKKLGNGFECMRMGQETLLQHFNPDLMKAGRRISVTLINMKNSEVRDKLNKQLVNARQGLRAGNECNWWIRSGKNKFLFAGFIFDMAMKAGYVQYNKDENTWQGIDYKQKGE